jgi:glycine betaine catabolism A
VDALPPGAYRSSELFAWEQRHLLGGSWLCVGRGAELDVHEQRALVAGGEGVLLTRNDDGRARAFHNVCRHRGHELLQVGERASGRVVRCPYHGWVYGLDGRLRSAPTFADVPGFDRADFPLRAVRLAEWEGWLFLNLSGDALDMDAYLDDLAGELAPYRAGTLVAVARSEYLVAANWKVIVENYHECYHCPSIHPELCRVSPPTSGRNFRPRGAWVGGVMDLRPHAATMSLDGSCGGSPLPGLDGSRLRQVLYVGLFPNLLVSAHPDYVLTHRLEPVDAEQTRVECEWLFPLDVAAGPAFDPAYAVDFWDVTNRQDWCACESVQRGLRSRGFSPGPLGPGEDAVRQFIEMVARRYQAGGAPLAR